MRCTWCAQGRLVPWWEQAGSPALLCRGQAQGPSQMLLTAPAAPCPHPPACAAPPLHSHAPPAPQGRQQARATGAALRAALQAGGFNASATRVLTSQWCRAQETGRLLGLGPVATTPALNSFFEGRSDRGKVVAGLQALVAGLPRAGPPLVFVTHQVRGTGALRAGAARSGACGWWGCSDLGARGEHAGYAPRACELVGAVRRCAQRALPICQTPAGPSFH